MDQNLSMLRPSPPSSGGDTATPSSATPAMLQTSLSRGREESTVCQVILASDWLILINASIWLAIIKNTGLWLVKIPKSWILIGWYFLRSSLQHPALLQHEEEEQFVLRRYPRRRAQPVQVHHALHQEVHHVHGTVSEGEDRVQRLQWHQVSNIVPTDSLN